jgi:hypothetical protein
MTPGPGGQFDHLLKSMKSKVQSQESGVETEESRVNTPESEVKPIEEEKVESRVESTESRVHTEESEVKPIAKESVESRVDSTESRVNTVDSEVKGLEPTEHSLESRVKTEESSVLSPESRNQPGELEKKMNTGVESRESRIKSLDIVALDEAIKEANVKPKLGVYSPLAAAMLRYKAITTPRYSMGSEMKTIIEQALKKAYPELYEEVQKRMKNN